MTETLHWRERQEQERHAAYIMLGFHASDRQSLAEELHNRAKQLSVQNIASAPKRPASFQLVMDRVVLSLATRRSVLRDIAGQEPAATLTELMKRNVVHGELAEYLNGEREAPAWAESQLEILPSVGWNLTRPFIKQMFRYPQTLENRKVSEILAAGIIYERTNKFLSIKHDDLAIPKLGSSNEQSDIVAAFKEEGVSLTNFKYALKNPQFRNAVDRLMQAKR